jgi:hypothetical protein
MNLLLLAQSDFLRHLGDFSPRGAWAWPGILTGAGVLTAVVLAGWLLKSWLQPRERRTLNSPARLLGELAAAHGLGYRQRQLLARLAKHYGLTQPALLFVEPELWSAQKLGPAWDRCRPELESLRERLFAA